MPGCLSLPSLLFTKWSFSWSMSCALLLQAFCCGALFPQMTGMESPAQITLCRLAALTLDSIPFLLPSFIFLSSYHQWVIRYLTPIPSTYSNAWPTVVSSSGEYLVGEWMDESHAFSDIQHVLGANCVWGVEGTVVNMYSKFSVWEKQSKNHTECPADHPSWGFWLPWDFDPLRSLQLHFKAKRKERLFESLECM